MLCCLDVDYRSDSVVAAAVCFDDWTSEFPTRQYSVTSNSPPEPYEPGNFYRRELPYLLAVFAQVGEQPATILIDGFVWLGTDQAGLGAHLYEALGSRSAVVGVAKRPFRDSSVGAPLLRGTSTRPLYVTSVGISLADAVAGVKAMHGPHRIPTLLKRVDRLCRALDENDANGPNRPHAG